MGIGDTRIVQHHIELKTHLLILFSLLLIIVVLATDPDIFLSMHLTCISKMILGINCPFCGMTRDFILMSRWEIPTHNPFSIVTALMIFIVYPSVVIFFSIQRKKITIQYTWMINIFVAIMLSMFIFNNLAIISAVF